MATGTALNSLTEPSQNFVVATENEAVIDFHSGLDGSAQAAGLSGAVHGLTRTGEHFGLGKIGNDGTLITDAAQAPGDILNGSSADTERTNIVADTGGMVSGVGSILQGGGSDMSNPNVVNNAVAAVTDGRVGDHMTDAANNVVNGVVDNLSNGLGVGDLGDGDVGGITDGLGLGDLGGGDVGGITDGLGLGDLGGIGNGGGSGEPIITVGAGESGGDPILDAGVLNAAPGNSPIGVAAGDGENLADINALNGSTGGLLSTDGVDGLTDGLGLGGVGGGNGESGESLVSVGAGESGGDSIVNAGVLNAAPGNGPVGVAAGSGDNIADVNALDGSNGHLISADGGAAGDPLVDAGVLTTPDSGTPLNADVGNGENIANASVLGNSDALQFPDLGGAGTDTLAGVLPTLGGGGITLPGTEPASGGDSLIEVATDGSDILTTNSDNNSLLGLNDQPVI